jgi:uncharacterized protein (DUF2141 family)
VHWKAPFAGPFLLIDPRVDAKMRKARESNIGCVRDGEAYATMAVVSDPPGTYALAVSHDGNMNGKS